MIDHTLNEVTVVPVHGAWADASSWGRGIALLHQKGVPEIAVKKPTKTLADDVATTQLALDSVKRPVVLAGHRWAAP
jgi:hypothetical protein